jgi:hypothetical protein
MLRGDLALPLARVRFDRACLLLADFVAEVGD